MIITPRLAGVTTAALRSISKFVKLAAISPKKLLLIYPSHGQANQIRHDPYYDDVLKDAFNPEDLTLDILANIEQVLRGRQFDTIIFESMTYTAGEWDNFPKVITLLKEARVKSIIMTANLETVEPLHNGLSLSKLILVQNLRILRDRGDLDKHTKINPSNGHIEIAFNHSKFYINMQELKNSPLWWADYNYILYGGGACLFYTKKPRPENIVYYKFVQNMVNSILRYMKSRSQDNEQSESI